MGRRVIFSLPQKVKSHTPTFSYNDLIKAIFFFFFFFNSHRASSHAGRPLTRLPSTPASSGMLSFNMCHFSCGAFPWPAWINADLKPGLSGEIMASHVILEKSQKSVCLLMCHSKCGFKRQTLSPVFFFFQNTLGLERFRRMVFFSDLRGNKV